MDTETQERITALETKISYMEDYVNSLQSVVLEHTKTIDLLRTENKLLAQKVKDMSELMEGDVPNRKPPHY